MDTLDEKQLDMKVFMEVLGYGERNADGDRVLEFAVANNFVIGNTFFVKRDSHLITYQSGNAKTQIDFILLRKRNLKMAKDIKVIPSEECVPQHKLLICELRLKTLKPHPKPFSPKLRYWKLKEPTVQEEYERVFKCKVKLHLTMLKPQQKRSGIS